MVQMVIAIVHLGLIYHTMLEIATRSQRDRALALSNHATHDASRSASDLSALMGDN